MQQRYRFWGLQKPPEQRPALFNADPSAGMTGDTATMRLYAPIDSWGGEWGVSAQEFADALDALPDTVKNIDLQINSPGGEVFEGLAILNLLRAHSADVTSTVHGIAASAASFVAVGAGKTMMAPNSQMMIHDAWGVTVGNAKDMGDMAGILDKMSNNIASIYASGSGEGDMASWRAAMQAESWYTADEAVTCGLAAGVCGPMEPASNSFDLTIFTYQGRAHAPAPGSAPVKTEGVRFTEQAESVVADVTALIDRATEVVALRAGKGKGLAPESADLLARLGGELTRLRDLTREGEPEPTTDEAVLAFLAKKTA